MKKKTKGDKKKEEEHEDPFDFLSPRRSLSCVCQVLC
jgi:hypothetical protein